MEDKKSKDRHINYKITGWEDSVHKYHSTGEPVCSHVVRNLISTVLSSYHFQVPQRQSCSLLDDRQCTELHLENGMDMEWNLDQ